MKIRPGICTIPPEFTFSRENLEFSRSGSVFGGATGRGGGELWGFAPDGRGFRRRGSLARHERLDLLTQPPGTFSPLALAF